jgi:hypothetical protein
VCSTARGDSVKQSERVQEFNDIKVAMAAYAAEHVPLANVKDNSVIQLMAGLVAKRMIADNNVRGLKRMLVNGMPEMTEQGVYHWLIELSGGDPDVADRIIRQEIVDFYGSRQPTS